MADTKSALECSPFEFVREVAPGVLDYYVDDLSGLFLPQDFVDTHKDSHWVRSWSVSDRLQGKFGRFAVLSTNSGDHYADPDHREADILIMGTTIGLEGVDDRGHFTELRHRTFTNVIRSIVRRRQFNGIVRDLQAIDYGDTEITVGDDGRPASLIVSGYSTDYGRAHELERNRTCQQFKELLGPSVTVVNEDPVPTRQRILDPPPTFPAV